MNGFVLIVEFRVKPDCLGRFHLLIESNAKASVADEPGCRQFDVLSALEDSTRIVLYEVYDDEDAFKVHLGMPHTQFFLAAAKDMITGQTITRLSRDFAPHVKA